MRWRREIAQSSAESSRLADKSHTAHRDRNASQMLAKKVLRLVAVASKNVLLSNDALLPVSGLYLTTGRSA